MNEMNEWYVVSLTDATGRSYAASKHDWFNRAIQEANKWLKSDYTTIEVVQQPQNIVLWQNGRVVQQYY